MSYYIYMFSQLNRTLIEKCSLYIIMFINILIKNMLVYVRGMTFLLHIKCSNIFMITKLHFNRIIIYTALQSKNVLLIAKMLPFCSSEKCYIIYGKWWWNIYISGLTVLSTFLSIPVYNNVYPYFHFFVSSIVDLICLITEI